MDLLAQLRSIPSLDPLSPSELDVLAMALMVESYPDGHVFIREGKRGDTAFFVLEGEVTVTRERGSKSDEINRMGPGNFFGLLALLDDEPRSASCRAAGPVTVASLPQSAFTLLFNTHAPVAYALQRALAEQLARDFRNVNRRLREARSAK